MTDRDRQRPGPRPGSRARNRSDRPGRSARRGGTSPSRDTAASPVDSSDLSDDSDSTGGPRRIRPRREKKAKKERTFLGLSTGKAVVLAVIVCALALTLAVPLRTYIGLQSDARAAAAERAVLADRVEELTIRKTQTDDPAYITAQARERLGFVMPGETPYQVQLPGARARSDSENDAPEADAGPWYSTLWSTATEQR